MWENEVKIILGFLFNESLEMLGENCEPYILVPCDELLSKWVDAKIYIYWSIRD